MGRPNNNIKVGKTGENHATDYLLQADFSIVERNWRFRRLEVDIIAAKDGILHFVEVKTRNSTRYGFPETAVSGKKMRFLKEAAAAYQTAFPAWEKVQFDVIAIQLHLDAVKDIHVNWDVYF